MRTVAALIVGVCGLAGACSSDTTKCTSDAQCGSNRVCDTGFCKTASPRTIGEPCTSDGACSVGSSCATSLPGGLCTFACAGDTCPTGAVCTDLRASGSGLFCSTACTTQAQCRDGYTCCPGLGACVPAAICPAQDRAVSASLGKACTGTGAGQCTGAGEMCGTGPEFPGGACTAACNPSDQRTCPSGSTCVSTSTGSFCFAQCTTDCAGVNSQLTCVGGLCRSATASPSCNPTGSAPAPVNGGTAGPPNPPAAGTCVRTVQTGSLPTAAAPGQQKVGTKLTFTVPPRTGTISIVSQGIVQSDITVTGWTQPPDTVTFGGSLLANSVVPTLLKDPTGSLVYDDDPSTTPPADPSGLDAFYGGASPWTGMMTVPNAAPLLAHTALSGGLLSGQWEFLVNDFALECGNPQHANDCAASASTSSTYDIQVLLKPGVAPATGTVDVAFYVVSGTAAAAILDPNFPRMTQRLAQIYASAGLCLGKVTVYDLPAWAQSQFGGFLPADDGGSCGQLRQLFTLAAPGNQINFFLVNGFSLGGKPTTIVGVDGTIPGPSSFGGTINSGAAVLGTDIDDTQSCSSIFDPVNCGPDKVAYIAAHEGGHFLGLYHTTENTGDAFDPLSDTKKCSCELCASPASARSSCSTLSRLGPPTLVVNRFCVSASSIPECGGGTNLMFWLLGFESAGALTPQQGQVMRANPIVR